MTIQALLGTEVPENRPMALLDLIEVGLPMDSLTAFKHATGMTDEEVARVLNLGERTLSRVRRSGRDRLTADLSDRLFAVASLYRMAEEVLGDEATGIAWLSAPQFGLGNRIPRDLLASEFGRQQVRSLLQRIEYGHLA